MIKKRLFIFGTGSHSKLVLNEILKIYKFDEIFFFNTEIKKKRIKLRDKYYVLINNYKDLKAKVNSSSYYFIAAGSNQLRKKIFLQLKKKIRKLKTFSIISSNSHVDKTVKIGSGSIIMPGVIINYNSKIGKYSIINTSSSIDHDNTIGEFTSIGPGVNTAGNVKIEDLCTIGIGAKIKDKIVIRKNTIIGGCSFVNKNCGPNNTYFGIPIRKIR